MTTVDEDEPFNELVDLNTKEMHAVGKSANGTAFLIAKSAADDGAPGGLIDGALVRELLGGSDAPEAARPHAGDTITMSGSPGAIVRLMKEAASRRAVAALDLDPELDQVVKATDGDYVSFMKAKYSAEDKRKLAAKGHAMRNADGEPDYPVDDEEDLGKAIHAVGRGGTDHDKIRKYLIGRAKAMGKSDQIPDNWASDGSIKQPVAKADGTDPGSPAWEATDAASGQAVTDQILACIPAVQALAMREATEVGAGHTDDICDVLELQGAIDQLTCAAKTVAGFVVSERAEAGAVAKAQQQPAPTTAAPAATSPKESTVETTTEGTAAAGTEPTAVSKAAALAAQLGISPEKLQELGAQAVLKAAQDAAAADTKTTDANPAPADTARVIPGTDTVQSPVQATDEVSKAAATQLATAFGEAVAPVVKQLGELTTQVNAQLERVEKMAGQPDDRRSPLLNGATGVAGPALRDVMAKSPEWQTIAKAVNELPDGPAKDEAKRKLALQALEARFS
jgi:hypothetical protein